MDGFDLLNSFHYIRRHSRFSTTPRRRKPAITVSNEAICNFWTQSITAQFAFMRNNWRLNQAIASRSAAFMRVPCWGSVHSVLKCLHGFLSFNHVARHRLTKNDFVYCLYFRPIFSEIYARTKWSELSEFKGTISRRFEWINWLKCGISPHIYWMLKMNAVPQTGERPKVKKHKKGGERDRFIRRKNK